MSWEIRVGDVLDRLREMDDESVQCVVTSPPYWGLRDYGEGGQIGLEPTPGAYVAKMVGVFREVRRVLRADGTLWLNLGDSYNGSGGVGGNGKSHTNQGAVDRPDNRAGWSGLKPKDLVGIPWRVAFALQADGWWLRSDIIWSKPNPMPESVTDRPTKAHEYIFLLTKSERYFYDADAVAEPSTGQDAGNGFDRPHRLSVAGRGNPEQWSANPEGTRNKRTVWTITTKPYPDAHFATFPQDLPEVCIKAGTSEKGCCPECGAPWSRTVAVARKRTEVHPQTDKGLARAGGTGQYRPNSKETGGVAGATRSVTTGWRPTCDCAQHEDEPGVHIERPDEPTDMWVYQPEPCTVLDPFSGAGTTGVVATRLGRSYIGIELNPDYAEMSRRRIMSSTKTLPDDGWEPTHDDLPLFHERT